MQILRIKSDNFYTSTITRRERGNDLAFCANLDVKNLNHMRWNKIAEQFKQATKEFPNDTLAISVPLPYQYEPNESGVFSAAGFIVKSNIEHNNTKILRTGLLNAHGAELLTELEDNVVVEKLVKLHKILRAEIYIFADYVEFLDKLKNKYKDFRSGMAEFKFDKLISEACDATIRTNLIKDKILAKFNPRVK